MEYEVCLQHLPNDTKILQISLHERFGFGPGALLEMSSARAVEDVQDLVIRHWFEQEQLHSLDFCTASAIQFASFHKLLPQLPQNGHVIFVLMIGTCIFMVCNVCFQ